MHVLFDPGSSFTLGRTFVAFIVCYTMYQACKVLSLLLNWRRFSSDDYQTAIFRELTMPTEPTSSRRRPRAQNGPQEQIGTMPRARRRTNGNFAVPDGQLQSQPITILEDNNPPASQGTATVSTLTSGLPPLTDTVMLSIDTAATRLVAKFFPLIVRNRTTESTQLPILRREIQDLLSVLDGLEPETEDDAFIIAHSQFLSRVAHVNSLNLSLSTYLRSVVLPVRASGLPSFLTREYLRQELVALARNYENFRCTDREMSVDTPEITIEDHTQDPRRSYNLGKFRIILKIDMFDGTNGTHTAFRVMGLNPERASDGRGGPGSFTHPHIRDGVMCPGDPRTGLVTTLPAAMNQGRILDGFDLIFGLLRVYNALSPFKRLHEWNGIDCFDCHNSVPSEQTKRCWRCERNFCSTCAQHCTTCNRDFCRNCGTRSTTNRRSYNCHCLNSILCGGGCGTRYDQGQLQSGVGYSNYCEHCLYRFVTGNILSNRTVPPTAQPPNTAPATRIPSFDALVAEDRLAQPVQPARRVTQASPPVNQQWRESLTNGSLDDLLNDLRGHTSPLPATAVATSIPGRRRQRNSTTGQWETVSG